MRFSTTILVGALCVALVRSLPVPDDNGFNAEALDRRMMAGSDSVTNLRSKRTIGILRVLFPDISKDVNPEADNQVAAEVAESQNNEVRVQFADEQANEAEPPELAPLEEIESSDDENRNKRFLNFGFGGGGAGGGSGAGSGNFLFDIIRQAADGAARAAGTVYRVVAGTQSLGLGLSATRDLGPAALNAAPAAQGAPPAAPPPPTPQPGTGAQPPLVAGSGSNSQGNSSASSGRTDGTQEAVPGPITRLFVIANRGISNLIQDLILRLAATSERIVNFKARLITSII